LTDGKTYYVINVDRDTLKLAGSKADADAGTPAVNLTGTGTGTAHRLENALSLQANFGFVGVSLAGSGNLTGEIKTGFKDPSTSGPAADGRISLTEFINGLGDIGSLIEKPTLTGGGSLDLEST